MGAKNRPGNRIYTGAGEIPPPASRGGRPDAGRSLIIAGPGARREVPSRARPARPALACSPDPRRHPALLHHRYPPPWHAAAAGFPVLAANSVGQVINNTTIWLVGILAGLATLFLTIGGVRYLMAGGDPAEVQKAKIALRSAAIGYGLAVLAPVIVTILKSLTGGP